MRYITWVKAQVSEEKVPTAVSGKSRWLHATVSTMPFGFCTPSDPDWVPDTASNYCGGCTRRFNFSRRRHHCRRCCALFCHGCSSQAGRVLLKGYRYADVRLCDACVPKAQAENACEEVHAPWLAEGVACTKFGLVVPRRVVLATSEDWAFLLYRNANGTGPCKKVALAAVVSVRGVPGSSRATAARLTGVKLEDQDREHHFELESPQEAARLVAALVDLAAVAGDRAATMRASLNAKQLRAAARRPLAAAGSRGGGGGGGARNYGTANDGQAAGGSAWSRLKGAVTGSAAAKGGRADGTHHQVQSVHQTQTDGILAKHRRRHDATRVREKSRTSRENIRAKYGLKDRTNRGGNRNKIGGKGW